VNPRIQESGEMDTHTLRALCARSWQTWRGYINTHITHSDMEGTKMRL